MVFCLLCGCLVALNKVLYGFPLQAEALFPEAVAMSRAPSLEFDDDDFLPATEVFL